MDEKQQARELHAISQQHGMGSGIKDLFNKTPFLLNDIEKEKNDTDFWVECNICKQQFKNWVGSTPCCGSIAFIVENGKTTNKLSLFASINGGEINPSILEIT